MATADEHMTSAHLVINQISSLHVLKCMTNWFGQLMG